MPYFFFSPLLIKNSSRVFERGSVGLVETQLLLRLIRIGITFLISFKFGLRVLWPPKVLMDL